LYAPVKVSSPRVTSLGIDVPNKPRRFFGYARHL
jgi:hypothetical protein